MRAAHSPETLPLVQQGFHCLDGRLRSGPALSLSCLNRFVYVKGVENLTEALQDADTVRDKVSTVGLAAPEDKIKALATELARWGVTRVCPLGQMQNPALAWRRDGRPALADLVTWTDWETE